MASQPCPVCGTEVPTDPRFTTWCHDCDWNLEPPPRPDGWAGRRDRISETVARRLDEALFARLIDSGALRSRLAVAKAAAYAIAIVVHASALAVAALGASLVAGSGPVLKIVGVVMLGLAYLMRPRLGRRPTSWVRRRDEAPALHGL